MRKSPFPLTTGLRGTTLVKAFFLNAIALAIVSALSIEVRQYLDYMGKRAKGGWALSDLVKTGIVFVSAFSVALAVYFVLWVFVGFGGGLIATEKLARLY